MDRAGFNGNGEPRIWNYRVMIKRKNSFYCLYKPATREGSFQVIMLAQKAGVISPDYLFEKAAEFDLEHIFTPTGGNWKDIEHFLAELLRKRSYESVWLLELDKYNQEIQKISKAGDIYSVFEKNGRSYPDEKTKRNLKERFLKI